VQERAAPSAVLIALTLLPLALLVAVWLLTGGFSEKPPLSPFYSKILPLALVAVAAIASIFAYSLARDEEPEWGTSAQRVVFKAIEGALLAYLLLSAIFAALLLLTYFL